MKPLVKTLSLILATLSALLVTTSCHDDIKPQETEIDFSVSLTPPQTQVKEEGQTITTQLLITEQEADCPRPTKYSVRFAYDEKVGSLLFLGKAVSSNTDIPLTSLANLSLTYQAKKLMKNKVKVRVTNDAPKAISKEATWMINADDTYSIKLEQEGEGELFVHGMKSLDQVPAGTKLTVTAIPAEGWNLVALTANGKDILKTKSFEVADNTTIRATFTQKAPSTHPISILTEGQGEITIDGADDLNAVPVGTKLTVTAKPAEGWEMTTLTANGADILASQTFVLYNPTEIKAVFTKRLCKVTMNVYGKGRAVLQPESDIAQNRYKSSDVNPTPNKVEVITLPYGTVCSILQSSAPGWRLTQITVKGEDITSKGFFTIKEETTVDVTFVKRLPTSRVQVSQEGEGNIIVTGADDLNNVEWGTWLEIAVSPENNDWYVKAVTVNGKPMPGFPKYDFQSFILPSIEVHENLKIHAVFAKKPNSPITPIQ